MTFKLEIECDNAAFESQPEIEIGRILETVARRLANNENDGKCRDINGNSVGYFKLSD